ncbi:MAG: EcsC family protein [Myxococcales bacterium]|nr:EcsC family protein [Myxococcales bacterium]
MTDSEQSERQGQRLLTAVERLVDDCDNLIAQVEALRAERFSSADELDESHLIPLASRIISGFSNKSALSGAVTALPGLFPGPGTAVALVGGSLADMTLMLKHEVEMALSLTYLYGHDIRDDRERWLAYVLATVSTYEADSGRNYFVDLAAVQLEAMRMYTPRQLTKFVATAMGRYALLTASRNAFKAIPFVGIAVGASANKLLTNAVGWRCVDALSRRRATSMENEEDTVEAKLSQ